MYKKHVIKLMIMLFIQSLILPVTAFGSSKSIKTPEECIKEWVIMCFGSQKAYALGKDILLDLNNPEVVPFYEEYNTYIPIRVVIESLGGTVE